MRMFKILFFTALVLWVPLKANNSFQFSSDINFWESELTELKSNGFDVDEFIVDEFNNLSRFDDIQYNFSINGSFEIFQNFDFILGIGLTNYKFNFFDEVVDKDNASYSIHSSSPGFLGNLAFSYSYPLSDYISLTTIPQFKFYLNTNSIKKENYDDGMNEYNFNIDKNLITWKIPIIVSYKFDYLEPFAGLSYSDYNYKLIYKSTFEDVFGTISDSDREFIFNKKSKINVILGAKFRITESLRLIMRADFLDGYDFSLNFVTNL